MISDVLRSPHQFRYGAIVRNAIALAVLTDSIALDRTVSTALHSPTILPESGKLCQWMMGNGEWGMGNGEWGMGNGKSSNRRARVSLT